MSSVASLTVNQLDGRNLLWRSVIRYGTRKIWYWPLLMTLVVARLGTGLSITETASGLTALGGSLMTIQRLIKTAIPAFCKAVN